MLTAVVVGEKAVFADGDARVEVPLDTLRGILRETDGGPGDWLTVGEAAEALGVSASSVRHWCSGGRIEARKIGRSWKVPASEAKRIREGGA